MKSDTLDINNLTLKEKINICLSFMNAGEVSDLCSNYGYIRDNIDADLIEKALTEHGKKFADEFVELYLQSLNKRQNKQKLENFSGVVGYNAEAMSGATNLIGVLGSIGTSIASAFLDTSASTEAQVYKELYAQQQAEEEAKTKRTYYIIAGVVVGVLVLAGLAIVIKKRR